MAKRVAVVAVAQTRYEPSKPYLSQPELIWEPVEQVRAQTGLTFVDRAKEGELAIDKMTTASDDWWGRQQITSDGYQAEVGAFSLDETRVCADGSMALFTAALSILSGAHEIALVAAVCKESCLPNPGYVENLGFEPIYLQPLGIDFLTVAALQARRYMYKYGLAEEDFARVVVRNRRNAKNNPYAQEPMDLEIKDVLASKALASPIRALDRKPVSEGACALILASEEKARKLTDKPVWVKGMGQCYGLHYPGDGELANSESLVTAARQAYKRAGVTDPGRQIDVAEISTEFSYQEPLWLESLGFAEKGQAARMGEKGAWDMGGDLPVNPSGGMLAGNPLFVAGLTRAVEAVLQLRGEAGDRQVDGARTALAHGMTGPCGQAQCVVIFEKD